MNVPTSIAGSTCSTHAILNVQEQMFKCQQQVKYPMFRSIYIHPEFQVSSVQVT